MKKMMIVLLGLALVIGFSSLAMAKSENAAPKGKVAICHQGGHDGDGIITGFGCGCVYNQEGEVIVVSVNACGGHFTDEGDVAACEGAVGNWAGLAEDFGVDLESCQEINSP